MAIELEVEDNKLRVKTQLFTIDWVKNTTENKKVLISILRNIVNIRGMAIVRNYLSVDNMFHFSFRGRL